MTDKENVVLLYPVCGNPVQEAHKDTSELTGDALREKIRRDAPSL